MDKDDFDTRIVPVIDKFVEVLFTNGIIDYDDESYLRGWTNWEEWVKRKEEK